MIACNRTVEQARRDFAAGRLHAATLLRVPMSGAWSIHLAGSKGDAGMLLDVRDLAPHVFTSLDAAVAALEQIGFSFTQLKLG